MQRLAAVIPTYNERENLPILVESLELILNSMNIRSLIVIVDDDSPDGTGMVAEQLSKRYGNISILHREGKSKLNSNEVLEFLGVCTRLMFNR